MVCVGVVAFSKCHQNSKLHFYSYAQVRVTGRLVTGDGKEEVGEKEKKLVPKAEVVVS